MMKYVKQLLCLLLALTCICGLLASCGGNKTGGGDTSASTTAPTPPTGTTAAPCTSHIYPKGSLCTTDRTCTVCGQVSPAAADHTPGVMASCGYQTCTACSYVLAEQVNRHSYVDHICSACGKKQPALIEEFTIAGRPVAEYKLVTPHKDNGETYIAKYIRYGVGSWHYETMEITNHNFEKDGPEIRIGQTNRTVTTVADNEYKICVVGEDLEIVFGSNLYAYEGLIQKLCELIQRDAVQIHLTADTAYSERFETPATDALDGDVRVMIHNVLQYVSAPQVPNVNSRSSMFRKLYGHYQPDVIGMQEANSTFFNANNGIAIKTYLLNNDYVMLQSNRAQPIFYKKTTVKHIADGYEQGNGGYGTSWALFQHIATGKYFGVGSSHFSADSVATSPEHGNELRVGDAYTVTKAKNAIIQAAKDRNIANADNLPIMMGGDYNCRVTDDPIMQVITASGTGLVNVRDVIEDSTKVDNYATHNGGPIYNEKYDFHPPIQYTNTANSGSASIDHIYCYAEGVGYTANQYRVITNDIAANASDHMAHYIDFSFK